MPKPPNLQSEDQSVAQPLFAASYAKLDRARRFILELEAELARYMSSKPLSVRFDPDANPPGIKVEWAGIDLAPGAIVGDTIHNLRTALDLMASELARLNGRSDKSVYFPFADRRSNLDAAIKSREFLKAGTDAVELLKNFAPYRGGNEMLRAVHDLDIQDKHTALIPTGSTMNLHIEGSYEVDNPAAGQFTAAFNDIFYIFPEGAPLGGQRIIETLKNLVELVDGILEAFAGMVALRSTSDQ